MGESAQVLQPLLTQVAGNKRVTILARRLLILLTMGRSIGPCKPSTKEVKR